MAMGMARPSVLPRALAAFLLASLVCKAAAREKFSVERLSTDMEYASAHPSPNLARMVPIGLSWTDLTSQPKQIFMPSLLPTLYTEGAREAGKLSSAERA